MVSDATSGVGKLDRDSKSRVLRGWSSKTRNRVGEAWLGRRPDTAKVAGSNPAQPTRNLSLRPAGVFDPTNWQTRNQPMRTMISKQTEKVEIVKAQPRASTLVWPARCTRGTCVSWRAWRTVAAYIAHVAGWTGWTSVPWFAVIASGPRRAVAGCRNG